MLFSRALAIIISLVGFASGQAPLPDTERQSLEAIARTLGKSDWDFNAPDPCKDWPKLETNKVNCTCTSDICHVTNIILKELDLPGSLPLELVGFPYLEEIDLSRNYLSGTIPPEWGSTKLKIISLLGNRITGPIPKELANISTLEQLVLEYNQLSGTIPPQLGNLTSIKRLLFTSNYLTGELPASLAKLTTLTDFRIGDNNFTGSIPNFIQNWTNITILFIHASGLTGPIPSGFASLTKLTELVISDLNGNESDFPRLNDLASLDTLILRNCNIVGELPDFIGEIRKLDVLDLSFNKLTGPIRGSFSGRRNTEYIYLTGNSLTGPLPNWILNENFGTNVDLSYNKLESGLPPVCPTRRLNLFASSKGNTTGIFSCVRDNCETRDYLGINCGGREVADDQGFTYEEDTDPGGASNFFTKENWGFSSTGHFLGGPNYPYTLKSNASWDNAKLYMDARLSPLSLTYYGFCLKNGNYTVNLHFAEIMFTNDTTYKSLGRRVFNVYIQGEPVLTDFNIEKEAGGVNIGIKRTFTAAVTDNTLDIRFYWAGKGTNAIPRKGVYGPLISAISAIHADYKPPSGNRLSAGAIVGITMAVLFTVFLLLGILRWKGCLGGKRSMHHDLKGLDLHTGSFSLRQIRAATNNFDPANKIGEGGFGPVYKGVLLDGTFIAVKQLSSKSKQGNREFVNEIGMISALQHPHLVKLYGCCTEGNQLLLVYEYMENNSLARALFGPEEHQLHLDWPTRQRIYIGIARGLAYLHEESRLKIVHRDIKATNVLLDRNLVPKISDFGLAKLHEEDDTHISTRIAGTFGYMAPEYAMRGYLTEKADVYSFGVVLLEIVSGRSNSSIRPKEERFYLLDWANSLKSKGDIMELVDPRLGSNFNKEEVIMAINVALLCTNVVDVERPSMSAVVSMLVGGADAQPFVYDSNVPVEKMKAEEMAFMEHDGQGKTVSIDVPWTASSASTSDLYPIKLDTDYWDKRDL